MSIQIIVAGANAPHINSNADHESGLSDVVIIAASPWLTTDFDVPLHGQSKIGVYDQQSTRSDMQLTCPKW